MPIAQKKLDQILANQMLASAVNIQHTQNRLDLLSSLKKTGAHFDAACTACLEKDNAKVLAEVLALWKNEAQLKGEYLIAAYVDKRSKCFKLLLESNCPVRVKELEDFLDLDGREPADGLKKKTRLKPLDSIWFVHSHYVRAFDNKEESVYRLLESKRSSLSCHDVEKKEMLLNLIPFQTIKDFASEPETRESILNRIRTWLDLAESDDPLNGVENALSSLPIDERSEQISIIIAMGLMLTQIKDPSGEYASTGKKLLAAVPWEKHIEEVGEDWHHFLLKRLTGLRSYLKGSDSYHSEQTDGLLMEWIDHSKTDYFFKEDALPKIFDGKVYQFGINHPIMAYLIKVRQKHDKDWSLNEWCWMIETTADQLKDKRMQDSFSSHMYHFFNLMGQTQTPQPYIEPISKMFNDWANEFGSMELDDNSVKAFIEKMKIATTTLHLALKKEEKKPRRI